MTVDEIISRLGRPSMMSELGVTTAQISNCKKAGAFPAAWFDPLDRLARADGWEMPREPFGWKRKEDAA